MALPVFLAGPLADPGVLTALGVQAEPGPARMADRSLAAGGPAGLPLWAAGDGVDGRVADLPPEVAEALAAALGGALAQVTLADGRRVAAILGPGTDGRAADWDAAGWSRRHAAGFAAAIPELIAEGAAAAPRLAMILSQSAGRLRAVTARKPDVAAGYPAGTVDLKSRTTSYRGFFSLDVLDLSYPRIAGHGPGEPGPVLRREVYRGTDAAILLPYDPAADAVLLVEQFRAGAYARGEAWPWTLEPVAGLIDAGETPAEAAAREAHEEAGIGLDRLIQVGGAYPSPGITSEFYHLFVGLADLSAPGGGGLEEEGEDIHVHVLPWDRFDALLDGARVLPMLTLGLWLRLNRRRLRQGG